MSHNPNAQLMDQPVGSGETPVYDGMKLTDDLVLNMASGKGIRVDTDAPTFGWRDITGYPTLRGNASVDPTWDTYRGNIRQFKMDTTNKALTFCFHLPHDYVPGSDMYFHVHWSHIIATVTTGGVTWNAESTYSKGHDQASFAAPKTVSLAQNAVTGASGQYRHMIAEGIISQDGTTDPNLWNRNDFEVDGLVIVRLNWSANTMDAGALPFVHTCDLHYQSNNMATKDKAPNFYTPPA